MDKRKSLILISKNWRVAEEANWLLAYVNSAFDVKTKIPLMKDNMNVAISVNNRMSVNP